MVDKFEKARRSQILKDMGIRTVGLSGEAEGSTALPLVSASGNVDAEANENSSDSSFTLVISDGCLEYTPEQLEALQGFR